MKSSLKKQNNLPQTSLSAKNVSQSDSVQASQIQTALQSNKGQGKVVFGSFQPIKTTKQSQKLRIAKIASGNVVVEKPIKTGDTAVLNPGNLLKQEGAINKQGIDAQGVQQNIIGKQQMNNSGGVANIAQFPIVQQDKLQNPKAMVGESRAEDKIQIKVIQPSQQIPLQQGEMVGAAQKQLKNVQISQQQQQVDQQNNQLSKLQQPQKQQREEIKQVKHDADRIDQQGQIQNFEYKVQNRRRQSLKSQLDISINKSIAEINEGYQARDIDKEKLDIRRLFKNNKNQDENDTLQQDEKRSRDVQDKIFNPQMSNYKGDRKPEQFLITRHTKLIDKIKLTSVINFEMINSVDPELRFYHLLFDLIEKTEKTVQQEYSQCPEFLYYLSILNNLVKSSFSKIATNRRKSTIIEQQQKVKECLFNKWETSKQRVMQNMISKYLKKYDKFQKIDSKVEQSKEYNYLKRTVTSQIVQSENNSIPQKEIIQKIEDQQRQNIIEIEQSKNLAIMKPVVEGLELIKRGQENIVEQQIRMAKSYEKLTKVVFFDWKEIDSFDEIQWLKSQQSQQLI